MFSLYRIDNEDADRSAHYGDIDEEGYKDAENRLEDESILLDNTVFREFLGLSLHLDGTQREAPLFCGAIKNACESIAATLRRPVYDESDVEIAKKLLAISNYCLKSLYKTIKSSTSGEKTAQKLSGEDVEQIYDCMGSLLIGLKRIIELGYTPFGTDEDECQAIANQYMDPILSFLSLEVHTMDSGHLQKVFEFLECAHQNHSQTQQLIEGLVKLMRYQKIVQKSVIKFMEYMAKAPNGEEDIFVGKIIDKMIHLEIEKTDSDRENQIVNLVEFIKTASISKFLIRIFSGQYRSVLDLFDDQEPRLRNAAAVAIDRVIKLRASSAKAGNRDEQKENDKVIREIFKACLRQSGDGSMYVRNSVMKMFSELYAAHNAYLNTVDTQELVQGLISITVERIHDISALVRAHSITLLGRIMTHNNFLRPLQPPPKLNIKEFEGNHLNKTLFQKNAKLCSDAVDMIEKLITGEENRVEDVEDKEFEELRREAAANGEDPDKVVPPSPQQPEQNEALSALKDERGHADMVRTWFEDGERFCETVEEAIRYLKGLLQSAKITDLSAIITVLEQAYLLNVEESEKGVIQMLNLVWLKNPDDGQEKDAENLAALDQTTNTLLQAFANIWLYEDDEEQEAESGPRTKIAVRLMELVSKLSSSELLSLERLFQLYFVHVKQNSSVFWDQTVARLWEIFATQQSEWRVYAAVLLSMLVPVDERFVKGKLNVILTGLNDATPFNYTMGLHTCRILRQVRKKSDTDSEPLKLCIDRICRLLVKPSGTMEWFGFAHEAIYAYVRHTSITSLTKLVGIYHKALYREDGETEVEDSDRQYIFYQLLYVVGEMVLISRSYIDDAKAEFSAKTREEIASFEKKESGKQILEVTRAIQDINTRILIFEDLEGRIRRSFLSSKSTFFSSFAPKIRDLCSRIRESLTRAMDPNVTQSENNNYSPFAQIAAISSLSKFMCVEKSYCHKNIKLLRDLLSMARFEELSSTLVIAMGDLNSLHSHEMENYTEVLFDVLKCDSKEIQRTALVVITFLILGGKVKVRGNLVNMALLLHDSDPRVKTLAQTFFSKYAQRDKDLYNQFIQILGGLAALPGANITVLVKTEGSAYQKRDVTFKIIDTLCSLLDSKNDTVRSLEKLKIRLRRCESEREFQIYKYAAEKLYKPMVKGTKTRSRDKNTDKNAEDPNPEPVHEFHDLEEIISKGFYDAKRGGDKDDDDLEFSQLSEVDLEPSPKKRRVSKRLSMQPPPGDSYSSDDAASDAEIIETILPPPKENFINIAENEDTDYMDLT